MESIEDFIKEFRDQFIDGEEIEVTPDTDFRQIGSWDSLTGMSVIVMIKDKYDVDIDNETFRSCNTPLDLFNIIKGAKNENLH